MNDTTMVPKLPTRPVSGRRVQVGRKTDATLNKRLEGVRMQEALDQQRAILEKLSDAREEEARATYGTDLEAAKVQSHEAGVKRGREVAMENYEAMLEESINNRLCDNDRDIPWPVGVMMAGEQHRILQALAEWLCMYDQPGLNAQAFGRHIGVLHYPEYLDAPSAVTYKNCAAPPKHIDRDQKGKQMELEQNESKLPDYSEHWKYYLRQLEDGTG